MKTSTIRGKSGWAPSALSLALLLMALMMLTSRAFVVPGHAVIQQSTIQTMNDRETVNVLANGDASVKESISLSASLYAQMKQMYPTVSAFTRVFNPAYNPTQYDKMQVTENGGNNSVTATYIVRGAAVNDGTNWMLQLPDTQGISLTLSAQNGDVLVFTYVLAMTSSQQMLTTATVNFPSQSSHIQFDSSTNTISYDLPTPSYQSSGASSFMLFGGAGIAIVGILLFVLSLRRNSPVAPS